MPPAHLRLEYSEDRQVSSRPTKEIFDDLMPRPLAVPSLDDKLGDRCCETVIVFITVVILCFDVGSLVVVRWSHPKLEDWQLRGTFVPFRCAIVHGEWIF